MGLSDADFGALSLAAGHCLGLGLPEVIASGDAFHVHDVACRLTYSALRASAFLSCEIGDPEPHLEADVYRQMLELQQVLFQITDATFGRDPVNDRLALLVRLPLRQGLQPQDLAHTITHMALQVKEWKGQAFNGKLVDYDREFEKLLAGMGGAR